MAVVSTATKTILETLLGSKLRAKVLGWLFTHPDERYFVRQLATLVGEDSTNMSHELARLEKTGILVCTLEGKQKYYQANRRSPIFSELKGLATHMEARDSALPSMADSPATGRIKAPPEKLAEFCHKHYIRKLSLFGSVLRDDFRPDSDIDVLVEFEPDHVPGFAIVDMEDELSRLLERKVDLRTPGDLSRYFRDQVMREAKVAYAQSET